MDQPTAAKGNNMIAVLCNNVSRGSAAMLADALKAKLFNGKETEKRDFTEFTHVFKYGFSGKIKANFVFNKAKPTEVAIDKIASFQALAQENITVPFTLDIAEASRWVAEGGCAVAREKSRACNAIGLRFCNKENGLLSSAPAKFWTRYKYHTDELRVNVWRGKVVSVYTKVQQQDEDGWRFKFTLFNGVEDHPQLVDIVQKVYNNIKLDWCGIDILRDKYGHLMVLEVNSAPLLIEETLKKLAKLVKKTIHDDNQTT
jgi:glutathione synthase/RimK-type ligase-like ATP-grasp enzyme